MAKPENTSDSEGLYQGSHSPCSYEDPLDPESRGHLQPQSIQRGYRKVEQRDRPECCLVPLPCITKYKAIKEIDRVQRRGAAKHIYRINPDSQVPDLMRATALLQRVGVGSERRLLVGVLSRLEAELDA